MHINYMHTASIVLKHGGCMYYMYTCMVDEGRMVMHGGNQILVFFLCFVPVIVSL